MRFLWLLCMIGGLLGLAPTSATAGLTFNLTFSGAGVEGALSMYATLNPDGTTYTATSGSGYIIGASLKPSEQGDLILVPNLNAPASFSYYLNTSLNFDDQLFPGPNSVLPPGQLLDFYGLMFTLANGTAVNIFGLSPTFSTLVENAGGVTTVDTPITFQSSAIPEPSSFFLLAIATPSFLACWWRRRPSRAIE